MVGYKINTKKICCTSADNELKRNLKNLKTIPFAITSKRIKYLGKKLRQQNTHCNKDCKTLLKETESTNKWSTSSHQLGKRHYTECECKPYKISKDIFFKGKGKTILKFA